MLKLVHARCTNCGWEGDAEFYWPETGHFAYFIEAESLRRKRIICGKCDQMDTVIINMEPVENYVPASLEM